MNLWHWRGPPYVAETFAFLPFCAFLNVIIILIKENKKKLTLCQRNEQTLMIRLCLDIYIIIVSQNVWQEKKVWKHQIPSLADPVEKKNGQRILWPFSDRSLTLLWPFSDLALLWLRTIKKHLKHCNYDSVAKSGIEGVEINTIILFFSDKN